MINGQEAFPIDMCSPDSVKYLSTSDVIINPYRLLIDQKLIQEMPQYLTQINQKLSAGGVRNLNKESLAELQEYLTALQSDLCKKEKIPSSQRLLNALNNFEKRNRDAAIWLEIYLEFRNPVPDPDNFVGPPTASEVSYIIDEEAAWERFKKRANEAGVFPE